MQKGLGINFIEVSNARMQVGCIIACDMPFPVDSKLLKETIAAQKKDGKKESVACEYSDTIGVPILFYKALNFKEVEKLLLVTKELKKVAQAHER